MVMLKSTDKSVLAILHFASHQICDVCVYSCIMLSGCSILQLQAKSVSEWHLLGDADMPTNQSPMVHSFLWALSPPAARMYCQPLQIHAKSTSISKECHRSRHRMVDMINQRMQNAAPQWHQVNVIERSKLAKAILVIGCWRWRPVLLEQTISRVNGGSKGKKRRKVHEISLSWERVPFFSNVSDVTKKKVETW